MTNNDPSVLQHLGDAYLAGGRKSDALDAWKLALWKDPNNRDLIQRIDTNRRPRPMPLPLPRHPEFTAGPLSPAAPSRAAARWSCSARCSSLCGHAGVRNFLFRDYGPRSAPHAARCHQGRGRAARSTRRPARSSTPATPTGTCCPPRTTKLMTALIVYEKLGGMNGSVRIIADDRAEPSNIPVVPGEIDLGLRPLPRAAHRVGQRLARAPWAAPWPAATRTSSP